MTVTPELDSTFRAAAVREGLVDVRYDVLDSPVGELLVAATDRGLARISYFGVDEDALAQTFGARVLRMPLDDVRRELARVPYGQTTTYGTLAAKVGRPAAARAVGTVMNRNPLPIVLPCHRVVGASGSLVGYAGGLEVKRRLLQLEGALLV